MEDSEEDMGRSSLGPDVAIEARRWKTGVERRKEGVVERR